jgi:hypothetical protein
MLISWSINIAAEDRHYSDNLSVIKEGSICIVKYKKNLIENSKRGTPSPVYHNFSMINSLVTAAEKLNAKRLVAVKVGCMVWGQDKTKSE